jgi:hypothetical protein
LKQLVQVKDTGEKANKSNRCSRAQSSKATGAGRDRADGEVTRSICRKGKVIRSNWCK